MTIAETIATCRHIGAICRKDHDGFRVTLPNLTPARAEAIAAYVDDASEAIAIAEHMTGKRAPFGWVHSENMTGRITYPAGRPAGAPVRFSAHVVNLTPAGDRFRARVTFPAESFNGQTSARWTVTKSINLPACLTVSAEQEAIEAAIAHAIGFDHVVTIDEPQA